MLYERDFTQITHEEEREWHSYEEREVVNTLGTQKIRKSLFREYPRAIRHHIQLFPNHYLDTVELKDDKKLNRYIENFSNMLDREDTMEQNLLNFINHKNAYFIIGSLLNSHFYFGHHGAFLFREFPLGTSYKADYLLLGVNSDGYHFVFIELEAPYGHITKKYGEPGAVIRKGMSQVNDWETWVEAYFGNFQEYFEKCKNPKQSFPEEFTKYDRTRFNYVVIAGRRNNFSQKTYKTRRKHHKEQSITLLHYDNLLDSAKRIVNATTY